MHFDIITIFPEIFDSFISQSLIARAIKKRLISIRVHNLRDWTNDPHKTVDGRPYGGGAGMVLKVEPIYKAVQSLKSKFKNQNGKLKSRIILLSAKGKQFTQKDARRLSKYGQLIFICGRYEGVDERVAQYIADEEISVGPYVLFGGEVPAMTIIEAVSRLIPGVVAKEESIQNESFSDTNSEIKEYPQYTRPEVFEPIAKRKAQSVSKKNDLRLAISDKQAWRVPKVLLSGNHKKIASWRKKHQA